MTPPAERTASRVEFYSTTSFRVMGGGEHDHDAARLRFRPPSLGCGHHAGAGRPRAPAGRPRGGPVPPGRARPLPTPLLPGAGDDLEVTGRCTVAASSTPHNYGNVNVYGAARSPSPTPRPASTSGRVAS